MTDYAYTTTRGATQIVPASIHKMIQRGMRFGHAAGELNKHCKFVVAGAVVKIAAKVDATIQAAKKNAVVKTIKVTVAKVSKPKVAGKPSNADLMRKFVTEAKKVGKTLDDAIAYGINDLQQNKSQAKNYATSIWNGK